MSTDREPSLISMVTSIGDDLAAMVRGHIELAQAEFKEAISGMAKFSGLIIVVITLLNLAGIFTFIEGFGARGLVAVLFLINGTLGTFLVFLISLIISP
jgi:uncharacterized membrane protein YqjE